MGYNGKKSLKTWVTSHFLGKSDRAADAALLGGKPPEYYAGPVNLLDNSYFEIAQAGYGGMHGNNRYAADRWQNMFQFGVFSAANPGIVMTYATNHAYAVQKIANSERYVGKMLTFGVMTDEYGLLLCTGLYTGTTLVARFAADTHEISIADDSVRVVVVSGTLTVRWAALYEGTYTAETFPTPAPRPYSTELAECQRYYERIGDAHSELLSTTTLVDGQRYAMFLIRYAPKRKTPTIIISDPSNYRVLTKGHQENMASAIGVESLESYSVMQNQATIIAKMKGDAYANNAILQRSDSASAAWIDVVADL